MAASATSIEELFPLVESCRAGDLEAVAAWIAAGKAIDPPANSKSRRPTPLGIAIEKDFLSLAKLLLKAGADPLANGNTLAYAVDRGRVGVARLLIGSGVSVKSVGFARVVAAANPDMIRLFIEHGADVQTGDPFFEALTSTVRPLLGIYKEFHERFPDWQRQLNLALLHYVREKSPQSVALLIWAGAQADASIRNPKYDLDETPIEAAAQIGDLPILKSLKPEKHPALLASALRANWLHPNVEVIEYLLGLGAPLNTADGGCELLDTMIRHRLDDWPSPNHGADQALKAIEHVCQRGARWTFQGDDAVKRARHAIKRIPAERLVRLGRILLQHKSVGIEFMTEVLNTPGMKKRLGDKSAAVEKLLRLPAPETIPPASTSKSPVSTAEVLAKGEEWLLRKLINRGRAHFTTVQLWESWSPSELRKPFGLRRDDERDPQEMLGRVCASLQRRLKSVRLDYKEDDRRSRNLHIDLYDGCEWADYSHELHALFDVPFDPIAEPPAVAAANLVCELRLDHLTKADFQKYRGMIVDIILDNVPTGTTPFAIWHFTSRREFQRCFPKVALGRHYDGPSHRLAEFFRLLVPPACMDRGFDVQRSASSWHYTLRPRTTWEDALATLRTEKNQPGLEARFGISAQAAALLEWLIALPADRLESGWSPSIESCNGREIGLKHPGGEENLQFHLQILLDEINESTPYRVRSFSWKEYNSNRTRLKLTAKPSDVDAIVRQIQWHAFQTNRMVDDATVRTALRTLLGE
ncbi:MAG: ankyrin repeat domain-containing protein [Opitutaceae bacterium]